MAIKSRGSIEDQVRVILTKQSNKIVDNYSKALAHRLADDVEDWQDEVRSMLSSPVIGTFGEEDYTPNKTEWPKKNEGNLYNSILLPTITRSYRRNKSNKFRLNQVQFTIKNFYGKVAKTRGVVLDNMMNTNKKYDDYGTAKPFSGWLNRSQLIWENLMLQRRKAKLVIGRD